MSKRSPFDPEPDPADEPEARAELRDPSPSGNNGPKPLAECPEQTDFHPYKVTLKSGSGYEAEWVTASYRTLDDLERDFDGAKAEQFAGVLEKVARVANYFRGKGPGSRGSGGQASGNRGGGAPQGAKQAPAWMGSPPDCAHGPRKYVTKTKDDGSSWHAWGCSGPRGDNCDPSLIFKSRNG